MTILNKVKGWVKMDKKGEAGPVIGLVMLGLAVLGLLFIGTFFGLLYIPGNGSGNGPFVTTTTVPGTPIGCPNCIGLSSPPDITPIVVDAENLGTALTDTMAYRKVGTHTWTGSNAGTEITDQEACATYEILFGGNTTTFTDVGYGQHVTRTIKCQEDEDVEWEGYNDELEGSLTATFFNNENNVAAQAITAGQIKSVEVKWEAGDDEIFGNPYLVADDTVLNNGNHRKKFPNMVACSVNSTQYQEFDKVWISVYDKDSTLVGTEMNQIGCGTIVSATAGYINYCYEAPVLYDTETRIAFKVVADDSVNPENDSTCYLYPGTYYINSDTGNVEWGTENEDGDAVGASDPDSKALDMS